MQTCTAEYLRLSETLTGVRCDGNAFVTFTNPANLANWTLPVIEATLVVIDSTGADHLHRGEAAMLDALIGRLTLSGVSARAAIADTWGAAHALALEQGLESRLTLAIAPELLSAPWAAPQ